jgi:hypothetical protein
MMEGRTASFWGLIKLRTREDQDREPIARLMENMKWGKYPLKLNFALKLGYLITLW